MRKLTVWVLLIFLVATLAGCSLTANLRNEPAAGLSVRQKGGLRISLDVTSATPGSGRPLWFVLTVVNRSGKKLRFEVPDSRAFEFFVFTKKGELIWRWSDGKVFAQVLTMIEIEPGESKAYRASYDGAQLPPGDYVVEGRFTPAPTIPLRLDLRIEETP